MKSTSTAIELPDDPGLPGMAAIREAGLAGAFPSLRLGSRPVDVVLRAHKPGAHATLECRAAGRHFAVKVYATDPGPEAAVYQALEAAGLKGESPVHVPPLIAWERELKVLVVGWLEGRTARELLKNGESRRAGELAAAWVRSAASLNVTLGPPFGAAHMLRRAGKWVAALGAADVSLGTTAAKVAAKLARALPNETTFRLVHGAFHDRNILDLGDGPGVIDWQRFGHGPAEIEAGKFLAVVSRLGLDEQLTGVAAEAEDGFLSGTAGLLNERALAWHRAAALLSLADRPLTHRKGDWLGRSGALLDEALRFAAEAG